MKKLLCLFAGITLSVLSLSAQDKFERFINRLNRTEEVCRRLINTGNELKRLSPVNEYDRQTTQVRVVGRRVKKVTIGDVVIVNKKDRVDVYRQKNGSRNRLALISKLYDSEHVYTAEALVTGGIVAYKVGIVVEDRQAVVFKLAGTRIAEEYDLE